MTGTYPRLPFLFNFAIEASVEIFMGQTSMQDRDLEQVFPKCSA